MTAARTFPLDQVCPDTHHQPNPSAPVHCPAWCSHTHPDRLWLRCCDLVAHSKLLETSRDQALAVHLVAGEGTTGTEPARLATYLDAYTLENLTPDQADDYATTLHRAAMRARTILEKARAAGPATHPARIGADQ